MKFDFAREWADFSGEDIEAIRARIGRSNDLIAVEWRALVGDAAPSEECARRFYEQSATYVYATLHSSQFHQDRGLPATLEI